MRYELKKLLVRRELWIVFGLSLLAVVLLSLRNSWADLSTRRVLREKTQAYFDMPLDEAEAQIAAELEQLEELSPLKGTKEYEEQRILSSFQISVEQYRSHESSVRAQVIRMYDDLEHAHTEYERRDISHALKLYNRQRRYRLTDLRALEFALQSVNYNKPMQYLWLLILCTVLAPLFAAEHESGMYQVLFISQRGKKGLFFRKIAGGMLCSALLAFVYTALMFLLEWLRTGQSFRVFLAPVQIAISCRSCPFAMTLLEYAVLTALMRALIGAWITALTALVSCFVRKSGIVFGVSAVLAAIPVLLSEIGETVPRIQLVMKQIGLIRLSVPADYLSQYETVNVFGFPAEQLLLSILCTVSIILVLLTAAYAFYTAPEQTNRKRVKRCSASKG